MAKITRWTAGSLNTHNTAAAAVDKKIDRTAHSLFTVVGNDTAVKQSSTGNSSRLARKFAYHKVRNATGEDPKNISHKSSLKRAVVTGENNTVNQSRPKMFVAVSAITGRKESRNKNGTDLVVANNMEDETIGSRKLNPNVPGKNKIRHLMKLKKRLEIGRSDGKTSRNGVA